MANTFTNLHHVCLVVEDMDEALGYFESIGVSGWDDYSPLSDYTEISLAREDFDTLKYKFTNLENFQLQLCQPSPGRTPQRKFLETRGPGVYHLGFGTGDVDGAEGDVDGAGAGLGIRGRGRRADGTGFTYFETEQDLGVTLEVRSTS